MEHHEISYQLNNSSVSKFVTKKWIAVNDLSCSQYSGNKNLRLKTSMLRPDLYNFSAAYIAIKETITVEGDNHDKTRNKKIVFRNNVPFR